MSEQDYGLIVTQPGYDAKDCPDRFLAFSSSFQTLKIYSKSTHAGTGSNITITHSLGFYAPFVIFKSDGEIIYTGAQGENSLVFPTSNSFSYTAFIFLENFDALAEENINTNSVSEGTAGDYGLRISKDGYDVKTCTDDQLSFSSAFYTNIIHSKGSTSPSSTSSPASVSHNLGYVPDFFAYIRYAGSGSMYQWSAGYDGSKGDMSDSSLALGRISDYSLQEFYTTDIFYYIIFKNRIAA